MQNLELLKQLDSLAKKKGATPGQLALAWVHSQGPDVFPIPGTKRIKYLEENVAAAFIELSPAERKDIEVIFEQVTPIPPDSATRWSMAMNRNVHSPATL